MQVRVSEQVYDYIRSLPPLQKQRARDGLRSLANRDGNIKSLEHPLQDYARLRIGPFRIILRMHAEHIDCIFMEKRSIVHEIFEQTLLG